MIKPEELRIGNLLHHKNDLCKVEAITFDRFIQHSILNNDNNNTIYGEPVDCFKPIPLTEEWHEKFGVKYNNPLSEYVYKIERKNNFDLSIIFGGDYVWIKQSDDKPINSNIVTVWNKDLTKRGMYVHEWQNLYYTLAGKELTIKE